MERYIGTDPQLEFTAEQGGIADWPTDELANVVCDFRLVVCGGEDVQLDELRQLVSWANKVQELSGPHEFILVKLGDDRQPSELLEHLGPLTADEFRRYNLVKPLKRKGINKGKGQRKANRKDRWK